MKKSCINRSQSRADRFLTADGFGRKIINMEYSTQTVPKPAYGWFPIALAATAALCAVPYLTLPTLFDPAGEAVSQALTVLCAFFLKVLLFVPLLAVTPALWARSAWRTHPAALGALALIAYLTGFSLSHDGVAALYSVGLIAPAGILLYGMQRMRFSNFRIVFYGSLALLLGLFIRFAVPHMAESGDAFRSMRVLVAAYETLWNEVTGDALAQNMLQALGSGEDLTGDLLKSFRLNAEEYFVELLYYPAAFAALSGGLLSHLFNRKGEVELLPLPPFEQWQVESGYFYGTLALTGISYVLMLSGVRYGAALLRVGYALWMLPMSLAGLCTLKRWTKRKPWLFAILSAAAIVLYSMFGAMLTFVGMLGFLQDRAGKRMQKGGDQ